jgi:hypothetical protein
MNQTETLAVRREALVAQSAVQRNALIESSAPLLRGTATLDRILGPIRRHPVLAAVAVGGVALLGSRKIFDLATRAVTIYMLVRQR